MIGKYRQSEGNGRCIPFVRAWGMRVCKARVAAVAAAEARVAPATCLGLPGQERGGGG